jgi:hypothetical protein
MSRGGSVATRLELPPVRALLGGLIDYAGLFPPAGLELAATVGNFAAYQRRADHWALARLVVPAGRLVDLETVLERLPAVDRLGTRWPLTVLLGPDGAADLELVRGFGERHVHGDLRIRSLEARAGSPAEVAALAEQAGSEWELYLELPLGAAVETLIGAVAAAGVRAKIRTGGIQPADTPEPEQVLAFLSSCARHRVPFKATAGLHHPVRARRPLTYESGSVQAVQFGYLNLFLAAAALWQGLSATAAAALLVGDERDPPSFESARISWAGVVLETAAIGAARKEFALAMGSCSFTEPLEEIEAL